MPWHNANRYGSGRDCILRSLSTGSRANALPSYMIRAYLEETGRRHNYDNWNQAVAEIDAQVERIIGMMDRAMERPQRGPPSRPPRPPRPPPGGFLGGRAAGAA